jgi:hypothetical protein
MTKNNLQVALEEDLHVDLTFHDFSVNLLTEFAERIVKPYFKGNTTQAIQNLMEKAITEETLFNQAAKH